MTFCDCKKKKKEATSMSKYDKLTDLLTSSQAQCGNIGQKELSDFRMKGWTNGWAYGHAPLFFLLSLLFLIFPSFLFCFILLRLSPTYALVAIWRC